MHWRVRPSKAFTVAMLSAAMLSSSSWAEEAVASQVLQNRETPSTAWPVRKIGFGSALGGGLATMGSGRTSAFMLPTLEARLFLANGNSVDLSIPLAGVLAAAATGEWFNGGIDAFYNFNLGHAGVRFLLGPGLGISAVASPYFTAVELRVPVVLGVEFLTKRRGFGFSLQARPFLDVGIGGNQSVPGTVGGGVIGVLAFNWYRTTP